MTMFVQLKDGLPTGYPVLEENLRQVFPEANFPIVFTPELVEPYGYGMYEFTQQPELDRFEKLVELAPTLKEDGIYYQTWDVVDMDEDEQAEATKVKAEEITNQRNYFLLLSDWTQLGDVTIASDKKADWIAYRQLLRDVPAQTSFPWEITWPVKPT